jgi:hypothetical protein
MSCDLITITFTAHRRNYIRFMKKKKHVTKYVYLILAESILDKGIEKL